MKSALSIFILMFSFVSMGSPARFMHTTPKFSPMKGKVKTIRSYSLMTDDENEVRKWGKNNYTITEFDETGKLLFSQFIENGIITGMSICVYDTLGHLIKVCDSDIIDDFANYTIYDYDTLGNLIHKKRCYLNEVSLQSAYFYKSGLLRAKKDSTSQTIIWTDYMYYDNKKLGKKVVHNYYGDEVTNYTYYKNGNILTETSIAPHLGTRITTFFYDENDNETLAIESSENQLEINRFATEYLYDSCGNWVCCIRDVEDVMNNYSIKKELTIREIEYY